MATETTRPTCSECGADAIRWGKDRSGNQRWRCRPCKRTWGDLPARPLGPMRLSVERAVLVLSFLVEGSSIRSAERVTGHHRDTIMRLLALVGGKCEALLDRLMVGLELKDVQADEIWTFCKMKQKTKNRKGETDPEAGDAYTFIAIDRDTKLVPAWALGKRDVLTTDAFVERLERAVAGRFQLTTDGLNTYPDSVGYHLGTRTDFATLVKEYGTEGTEEERRYSPPRIISSESTVIHGNPDPERICTSHIERQNLTVRMGMRRFTRLTNAFSKKRANLRAALALHFAHYNLVRFHSSIRMTPAMKAGVVGAPWSIADLLAA